MIADIVSRVVGGAFLLTAGWGPRRVHSRYLGSGALRVLGPWACRLRPLDWSDLDSLHSGTSLRKYRGTDSHSSHFEDTVRRRRRYSGPAPCLALLYSSLANSRLARNHIPDCAEPPTGVPGRNDNVLPLPAICSRNSFLNTRRTLATAEDPISPIARPESC